MQTATRAARRDVRRSELVDAAIHVFSTKGVSATSVDDIVRAAGVAKGTFYLYFPTKDDAVNAVAARIVASVADRVEAAVDSPGHSPVERLLTLGEAMLDVGLEQYERDLLETFHRPENRAVHDRISGNVVSRLLPSLAGIIADGIAAGIFPGVHDPRLAAAFVLATFSALHDVVGAVSELPAATTELNAFVLRGLGYAGEAPR